MTISTVLLRETFYPQTLAETTDRDIKGRFIKGHTGYCLFQTEETKRKISLAQKGISKPNSGGRGRIVPEETLIRMSLSKIGKHYSPDTEIKEEQHLSVKTEWKLNDPRITGENNHNWKGGITSVNTKIHTGQEYKDWANNVYKRDNWDCRRCGMHCEKKNIIAHHIKSFAEYPELRFEIDNGLTLCRSCHIKEHKCRLAVGC